MTGQPLAPEDEALLREHHASDEGRDRCVICRLLATIDDLRRPASEEVIEVLVDDSWLHWSCPQCGAFVMSRHMPSGVEDLTGCERRRFTRDTGTEWETVIAGPPGERAV